MKRIYAFALTIALAAPVGAQLPVKVDRKKYTDYSNKARLDHSLLRYGAKAIERGLKAEPVSQRPDHVNNAAFKHFPPVFNQDGGSCGSASRVGYMFTHEINSFRDADASDPRNQYPTHFSWLHTSGNSGKDEFVSRIGIPSAATYGGRTYSAAYGYQEEKNNDFGWMTGYDKWFEAMHNRMYWPSAIPGGGLNEPLSREAAKNWLWNHNGDPDFHSGGLIGIGVASAVTQGSIPKTDANLAAGVVGQAYVVKWGESVDHALTIVGYDDRIEFDLDGNGKSGEAQNSKGVDERGAWIIVNSWGMWANNGFIYCPYAYSGPVGTANGGWHPEIYNVRKNYRPLRTLRVKMDYSHRSEIKLQAGVSTNLKASQPESRIDLEHFRFAGDGKYGDLSPAPAIPMLGRWADGKLHDEPMEFGYDLTDLSEGYDRTQPLKYFFIIDSRTKKGTGAVGKGHVYHAGVLDYEFDREGIETAFPLKEESVQEVPGGRVTTLSVIVYGEQYPAPQNPTITGNRLAWMAPQDLGRTITAYKVYRDGVLLGETRDLSYPIEGSGRFSVSVCYASGVESNQVSVLGHVAASTENVALSVRNSGFSIPKIFDKKFDNVTIEYWMKPHSLKNWNQAVGPGWGKFMAHATESGDYVAGWDTNNRTTNAKALTVGRWNHVAITVQGRIMRLQIDNYSPLTVESGNYSGLGGFGDLVFSNSANNNSANDAVYDEIRIWDNARNSQLINNAYKTEFSGELMPAGLIAYYKGDVIEIDGKPYLRDCVGGYHAPLMDNATQVAATDLELNDKAAGSITTSSVRIQGAASVVAGQPAAFTAKYPDPVATLTWDAPEAGVKAFKGNALSVTYTKPGEYTVLLTAEDAKGERKVEVKKTIKVVEAEAPVAAFTVSPTSVPAGQRVVFSPTTPQPGYQYHWSMPSGKVASSNAITAATSYEKTGTYEVTLRVVAPNGQEATSQQKVNVVQVAPEADFSVSQAVVKVGESVSFNDLSKFEPNKWEWVIDNTQSTFIVNDKNFSTSFKQPGVYDITLTASNEAGKSSKTQTRVLTVVNADSKTGLSFTGALPRLTVEKPVIVKGEQAYTIEWWMRPNKLTDFCCGIGETDATFLIKADAQGRLLVTRAGRRTVSTAPEVVKPSEWHHYAVVMRGNSCQIYVDGVLAKRNLFADSSFPALGTFGIGTSAAEMSGQIDEFRVWGTDLSADKLTAYANAPIADVKAAEEGEDKLLLYYDFNTVASHVADLTSNANQGQRSGFGPDGDAWSRSGGVFSLNPAAQAPQDVTATYLHNYRKSFAHTTQQVNSNQSGRWYAIKDWTLENTKANDNGRIVAGVHVDRNKSNCFTFTTGWDGFPELADHKCYQTMRLPAGVYTFTAKFDDGAGSSNSDGVGSYLVAAAGTTLPVTAELDQALASAPMVNGGAGGENTVRFVLTEETDIALGLLINMAGQRIAMIQKFTLTRTDLGKLDIVSGIEAPTTATKSERYDLSGRRLSQPAHGQLYIENGKKRIAQ